MINPLRIHYFQHVPFEGLGSIAGWAEGHRLTSTRFWAGESIPCVEDKDLFIIMGGPMGAYDEDIHPWLREEKACIFQAIQSGKKVLGICLGAQLIASALGARVYPNEEKEIGWFPVFPTALDHARECLHDFLLENPVVFHWHGDTFDLPAHAVNHAFSSGCRNQLFSIGKQVIGIQFHLEVGEPELRGMIAEGKNELVEGPFVHGAQAILDQGVHTERLNRFMCELLNDFVLD